MIESSAEDRVVLVERRAHVTLITINRPQARNAVNLAVHVGIGNAIEEAESDREIRAIIITGSGDQSFCAGADLKALARGESLFPTDPAQLAWGFAGVTSHVISKPLIAAVNGFALGGGTEIALACDLIVAADSASFGLPEVKRGLIAGGGGAFRLMQQLPPKIAMEAVFTGEPITAIRALELGLVNAVVPRADLISAAFALADRIAANAPLSVQATKRIALGIVDGRAVRDTDAWAMIEREWNALVQSEDAREGPRAFAEKRAPVWKGR